MNASSRYIPVARRGAALLSSCLHLRYLKSCFLRRARQLNYRLMQRETVALTQMLLDLSRVPYADLRKETAP